jgi:hypothetical protein
MVHQQLKEADKSVTTLGWRKAAPRVRVKDSSERLWKNLDSSPARARESVI